MAAVLMNVIHLCAPTAKFQPNLQIRSQKDFISSSCSSLSPKPMDVFSPAHYRPLPSKKLSNKTSTSAAATADTIHIHGKEDNHGSIKLRVALKFVWMEKHIGVALDQVIPGHGSIPLSPYYWWPRTDAWEELKKKLEEKDWIPQKQAIVLLNQATDIINLWQQTTGNYLYG